MDRIATSTKSVDMFGAGKHGFKDGNLGLGVAPTDFNAEWFNGVQEELLSVIEAAGIAPSATTRNQLLASLAGALASRPDMAHSHGANGYQKLPGGLILQWGSAITSDSADVLVTFPVSFTTALYSAVATSNKSYNGIIATVDGNGLVNFMLNAWTDAGDRVSIAASWFAVGK